jgi:hypothetical protein
MDSRTPSQEDSLAQMCDRLRASGHLVPQATSRPVLRLLACVLTRALPTLSALDPENDLSAFLEQTPARLVHQHRLLIQHDLKIPHLATELGFTAGTLRVYRCHLQALLKAVEGVFQKTAASSSPFLLPGWVPLMDQARMLVPGKSRPERIALKRFAGYCSAHDIEVNQVTVETTRQYQTWLWEKSGIGRHKAYYSYARKIWGLLHQTGNVPALEFAPLPGFLPRYGMNWEEAPALVADAFILYARLATSEDLDERLKERSICQSTLQRNRTAYLAYMGFLRDVAGVDLDRTPLPALFEQKHLEAFHAFALERAGGKAMGWHVDRMFFLRHFAVAVVTPHIGPVDTTWMEALIAKTTRKERYEHAPEYSREMVEQVLKVLDAHIAEAEEKGNPPRQQVPFYSARFALTFLADHPLRGINLRESFLNRQFSADGGTFRVLTKNRVTISEKVSEEAFGWFQRYLAVRRRAGIYSTAMLVSKGGRPMCKGTFYSMVVRWFQRGAGIHFTPRCFRYLAVGEALERTSDPVYAGAVIGDRSGKMVDKSYNRYAMAQAARAWSALQQAFLQDLPQALPPPVQQLLQKAQNDPQLLALIQDVVEEEEGHVARQIA